jgi:hypothetical protein
MNCGLVAVSPSASRGRQAVVEIDEYIGGPDLLPEFVAGDHPAGAVEQQQQDLIGLLLEPDTDPLLTHLVRRQVHLEDIKAVVLRTILRTVHSGILRRRN